MIYYGTDKIEVVYFYLNDESQRHFITMEQDSDENIFYVRTCCNVDWEWKFEYTTSNYEMIKHAILDAIFDSEDMHDLLYILDEIFEEGFNEIVIFDECDCDCENGCNHCGCK